MGKNYTEEWKRLFRQHCRNWDAYDKQRYVNIPNDPEDVTEDELQSCKELVAEIKEKASRKEGP